MLLVPLPGQAKAPPTPQTTDDEGAGFMEFMSQVTAG